MPRQRRPYNLHARTIPARSGKARKVYNYTINPESGVPSHLCERRKSTGCSTKAAAERFVLARIEELKAGSPKVEQTLCEYLDPFFVWDRCPHVRRLVDEGKSITPAYTRATRSLIGRRIIPHRVSSLRLQDVTRADVLDFRASLRHEMSPRMVNRTMAALKVVFNEALYREDIEKNPCAQVGNVAEEKTEIGVFTRAELQRMFPLEGPGPWRDHLDFGVFLLAFATAMRRGEILALRWRNVDLEKQLVRVEQSWKDGNELGKPKWGKERVVPLADLAASRLYDVFDHSEQTHPESLVFCWADGTRLSDGWWKVRFREGLKRAGIPGEQRVARRLRPHSLRHTAVSLVRGRVDTALLQDVIGHSDGSTTDAYTHYSMEDKQLLAREIAKVLSPQPG